MDTPIQTLIESWLNTPTESPNWQSKLEKIVNATLNKRKVAQRRPGKQLEGIYQDIFDALKAEIKTALQTAFEQSAGVVTDVWLSDMLKQAYPKVLTYGRLTQLAVALQHQVFRSPDWQYALAELFKAVYLSDKLRRPGWASDLSPEDYADIQNEALEKSIKDIQKFDPNRAHFIGWINQIYLKQRGIDSLKEQQDSLVKGNIRQLRKLRSLSNIIQKVTLNSVTAHLTIYILTLKAPPAPSTRDPMQDTAILLSFITYLLRQKVDDGSDLLLQLAQAVFGSTIEFVNLDTLTTYPDGKVQSLDIANPVLAEAPRIKFLMECLETCDEEQCAVFLEKHVRNHPAATLRFIAQERLRGKKLREIGDMFDVIPQTIRNFYERNIKNVTDCLKRCLDDKIEVWELQNPSS